MSSGRSSLSSTTVIPLKSGANANWRYETHCRLAKLMKDRGDDDGSCSDDVSISTYQRQHCATTDRLSVRSTEDTEVLRDSFLL